jgi:filamentous hemagglutinin family protein
LAPLAAAPVLAGPNGANVVGGAATVQGQGTANVIVNQSTQNAIINWQTFNIGSGETTKIYMPNSNSAQLDRVTGGQGPSQILGTLYSNGKVFLVNPDGILFGMGARINVGSLVATTNDIANKDFMAGRYNFSIPGNPNASIANLGTITAQTGGFAALVAPGVRNTGTITARLGTIALASGNVFTLDMYGDNLITLGLTDKISSQVLDVATGKPLKSLVSNAGKLKANGGTVVLTAVAARKIVDSVINNSGVIEADTFGAHKGVIVLSAATRGSKYTRARKQTVKVSGTLSAAGKRNGTSGGTIQITGENIEVAGATINASGQSGGGTVLIGGDWGGGHPDTSLVANASAYLQNYSVATATSVSIDAATMIDASATGAGNGGKVIVWSNAATTFDGTVLAKGGALDGNGGFVETSGGTLTFNGTVNTSAPNGRTGTWLLDPTDLTVDAAAAATIDANLATTNVTLLTNADGTTSGPGTTSSGAGDIIIAAPISWLSGNTLTLSAYNAITVNAPITVMGAGGLVFDAASNPLAPAAPLISFGNGASAQFTGTPNSGQSLVINGQTYTLLYSMSQLQAINATGIGLTGHYALAIPLDASGMSSWIPIGTNGGGGILNSGDGFNGVLQGLGNAIANLTINLPSSNYVGLFGYVGSGGLVQNIGVRGGSVSGGGNDNEFYYVGDLIGLNNGTVSNAHATGAVNVTISGANSNTSMFSVSAGGLVGSNGNINFGAINSGGPITNSYATGTVSITISGINANTIGTDVAAGGLVGSIGFLSSSGSITDSYATGAVNVVISGANTTTSGSLGVSAGGLVGSSECCNAGGSIANSYATGAVSISVTGTNTILGFGSDIYAGGLVGSSYDSSVANSFATGAVNVAVSGANTTTNGFFNVSAGGLVGSSECCNAGGSITNSYATGAVSVSITGTNTSVGYGSEVYAGGLVGSSYDSSIANSYATGAVNVVISGANTTTNGFFDVSAGGLVGSSECCNAGGSITNSYATGAVNVAVSGATTNGSIDVTAGGLVGSSDCCNVGGSITNSYATGAVSVSVTGTNTGLGYGSEVYAGGLVGSGYDSSIANSHASGVVNIAISHANATTSGLFDVYAGGLVGSSDCCDVGSSITNSYATGAVNVSAPEVNTSLGYGAYVIAGGLVGYTYGGSIANSYATGAVSVTLGPGGYAEAGGLVGENGIDGVININGNVVNFGGSITNSYATGAVSSNSTAAELGGLVGQNDPGGLITNSQAYGNVTSTASLPSNQDNTTCSLAFTCGYVNAGGFVGSNYGTISGTIWTSVLTNCATSYACASGNVAVGSLGSGGGFVGQNLGVIRYAFATGNVTGAAGLADLPGEGVFNNTTSIGGFTNDNSGLIFNSFATGNVGTAGTAYLSAAGFANSNEGTISNSFATGAVVTGDSSIAGGFVGSNSPDSPNQPSNICLFLLYCGVGSTYYNTATISNSRAYGNVTVGASSVAGGFAVAAGNDSVPSGGDFTNVSASGAVNAGHDSIVGGLVGLLFEGSTVANSSAQNTLVASSGANSIIGGVVGVNEGTISNTTSSAPVSGTSGSYIGGIAGINLGLVTGSATDPAISGTSGTNFIGGIAGLNVGSIDNSTANVGITGGTPDYVGGVAGVNGRYSNEPAPYPYSSFPNGTITNSSATGSGFSSQVGNSTTPAFTPPPPSWLTNCTDPACFVLTGGSLQPPENTIPTNTAFPNQQVLQFTQPVNFTTTNIAPPLIDPATLTAVMGGPGGNPGNNPGGNGNSNNGVNGGNGNSGTLANGRQGGNGAPPGMRLIDMRVMPLPPGTGLPPPGETRFLQNQVVLQFGAGMTPQQVAAIAQRFGLTIESQQTIGAFGRAVYTVQINNRRSVADVIRAIDNAGLHAAAQPNYTYGLAQDQPGSAADVGDPAQYIVEKLQLGAVHKITEGNDIVVALIDSRVDTKQPDLAGRIVDSYDAGCGPDTPPDAHGTGMAGAIASHVGLLGIAPNAKIMAICAFGGKGSPEATSTKIIRGVDYAIAHGAKIINMSFAGPHDPALAQELQIAREKGILIIAAAGNAGAKSPPLYPGADPNVMAVTATDEHDRLFNGANQGSYVTVAAPGVNILVPAPNGDVQFTTGTSVASANVSGVAALLLAEKPTRTPEEIRAILASTAKHLGAKGVNPQFGAGLVDPLKALRFVPTALGRKPTAEAAPPQRH